ncbi:hypothetical protein [Paucidesulfovibrio longus]|uniref:hypothetical protein n=1 Tax=Paucidesulfovibrio longus TaxID=889 RepID=UPI00138B0AEE|nr:hypothetical protein [Paucidesulfovibrio longus]
MLALENGSIARFVGFAARILRLAVFLLELVFQFRTARPQGGNFVREVTNLWNPGGEDVKVCKIVTCGSVFVGLRRGPGCERAQASAFLPCAQKGQREQKSAENDASDGKKPTGQGSAGQIC